MLLQLSVLWVCMVMPQIVLQNAMLANLQHKWEEWSREVEEALRREASIANGTQLELGEFKKASVGRPVCADCKFAL